MCSRLYITPHNGPSDIRLRNWKQLQSIKLQTSPEIKSRGCNIIRKWKCISNCMLQSRSETWTCNSDCVMYGRLKRLKSHIPSFSSSSYNKDRWSVWTKSLKYRRKYWVQRLKFKIYAWLRGIDGRNFPQRPVMEWSGSSQILKKPRMWSILYAVKYLAIC